MRLGTLGVTVPSVQDRMLYDHAISPTGVGDIAAIAEGAQRVILVGASKGTKASLVAAAGLPAEQVTAVVALSPEAALADGTPVLDTIKGTSFPALIVTVPGNSHGTALLSGATADQVNKAITAYLTQRQKE